MKIDTADINKENKNLKYFIENPFNGLIKLSIPILIGMIIHSLYHAIDMFFISLVSSKSIASLGFNMPIVFLIYGVIFGLGTGVTSLIAKYIGKKNNKEAKNIAEHALVLSFIVGLLSMFLFIIYGEKVLILINTPTEILTEAFDYLKIIAIGFIFVSLSTIFRAIYSGEGDSLTPMVILGTGTVLNIILDPIFIIYLKLGVKGAATATVISEAVVILVFIYVRFIKGNSYLKLKIKHFKFKLSILKDIFIIGIPSSLAMTIMSFGLAIYNFIIVKFGTFAVAGFQIVHQIEQFYFMPIMSVATATTTIIGMFYGVGRIDLIRKIIKISLSINVIWSLFAIIFFNIFALNIYNIFTNVEEVLSVSMSYISVIVFIYPVIAIGFTSGRIMLGLGTSIPMLITTALRIAIIAAPLGYFFTHTLDKPLYWMWYSIIIASTTSALISISWLKLRFNYIRKELATL